METDFSRVQWRKSSRSTQNGACVEVGVWRKSGHSTANGSCVELASCACCAIAVQDSKNPNGPKLVFSRQEVAGLVSAVKRGRLDL